MIPTLPLRTTHPESQGHADSLPADSRIPVLGLGTYALQGVDGAEAIASGIRTGYRLLDTAAQYGNEAAVGEGIRRSGIDPAELVVTTKVAGGDHGYEATLTGAQESRRRLGLEAIDILLIHWPNPSRGRTLDTWKAILDLVDRGVVKVAGVSNFRPEQLEELHAATGVWPAINQIQLHAGLPRHETTAFNREHGIVTESWGPLGGRHNLLEQYVLQRIAEKHAVTPEQVALRWIVQQDIVAIPKSSDPERQQSNLRIFDFDLDSADLAALTTLERPEADTWDSRTHEEW